MRRDGRLPHQMRPVVITPGFLDHPTGSALIEAGHTKVICCVSGDENLPSWRKNSRPPQGWLTAEYSMLPGSTHSRSRRERPNPSGRTQEIQRLIGRSLRGVLDLSICSDAMMMVDCDVIQADGGTRTTSITGAFVALRVAVNRMLKSGRLKADPITDGVAAVSIGLKKGDILVDLDYREDSSADLDMNVVMTHSGKILEIQGTAERQSFDKAQVMAIIEAAEASLSPIFEQQMEAIERGSQAL